MVRRFQEHTGGVPSVVASAPGRINLIGEHVDYQEGLVLPAAIDRHVVVAAREIKDPEVRLWSLSKESPVVIPLGQDQALDGSDSWANYVFGVVAVYREAGHAAPGFEALFDSTIPKT